MNQMKDATTVICVAKDVSFKVSQRGLCMFHPSGIIYLLFRISDIQFQIVSGTFETKTKPSSFPFKHNTALK